MRANSRQFATFVLDRYLFGVEVEEVQEIILSQEVTPVPLAPPVIEGLINLRGQIFTAIDLRQRLELGERPPGLSPMNVILRAERGSVSLLVDRIGDVITTSEDEFEPPPETLRGAPRELIRGSYKLAKGLLLVLNLEQVLALEKSGTM